MGRTSRAISAERSQVLWLGMRESTNEIGIRMALVSTGQLLAGDPGYLPSRPSTPDLYRLIPFGTTRGPFVISFESTMPISTRRLAARACSLSPGRRGSDLPKPLVLVIVGEIP